MMISKRGCEGGSDDRNKKSAADNRFLGDTFKKRMYDEFLAELFLPCPAYNWLDRIGWRIKSPVDEKISQLFGEVQKY
jgi:hypothetical protein